MDTGTPKASAKAKHSAFSLYFERVIRKKISYGVNPLLFMVFVYLVILSFSRALLTIWNADLLPGDTFFNVFMQGVRVDFASVCGLFAIPLLVLTIFSLNPFNRVPRFIIFIINLIVAAAGAFLVMNEMATPGFIMEYGVRPNHLYVQYLIYPKEVLATLWGGHKIELILSVVVTVAAFVGFFKLSSWAFSNKYRKAKLTYNVVALLLTLCIVPLGIRSTLGHRPLNPSMVAYSDNALVNSLPLNSSYSAVYALFHLDDNDVGENQIYRVEPIDKVLAAGLSLSKHIAPDVYNEKCPINQVIKPFEGVYQGPDTKPGATIAGEGKKYNVVVILEESLGDNFVASQGGFPMTPYLEKLKEKGWWFENLFAAGHRSIRGIEAVTAGMPPSPLNSIVKLAPPADPYATMFKVFRELGYKTSFIYGGEGHFDNMRTYFLENGMEKVIEQKDYQNPQFVGSWGVSDEDLFNRANEEFAHNYKSGNNFFSVVFSSSFHDPFEIPAGKVSLDGFKTDEPARLLAAKYADYALGKFLEKAETEDYYKDTIFLVIADHESRVRGTGTFPIDDFTIPAVIIGPNVKPGIFDERVVSQIDMSATIMSLAGVDAEVPNVGQNLTYSGIRERALMQFNEQFGYLEGNKFAVLAPSTTPYTYTEHKDDNSKAEIITPIPADKTDKTFVEYASALSNLGPLMYKGDYIDSRCITLNPKSTNYPMLIPSTVDKETEVIPAADANADTNADTSSTESTVATGTNSNKASDDAATAYAADAAATNTTSYSAKAVANVSNADSASEKALDSGKSDEGSTGAVKADSDNEKDSAATN